jgi:outer membrane protein assembly factor BamB
MGRLGKGLALVFTTFALISLIIVPSSVKAVASGDDWTMVNYDATHERHSVEDLPLNLSMRWNLTVNNEYVSQVAISNGMGYVYIHGNNGKLTAFNATTGETLWSSNDTWSPTASPSSPAINGGFVYTGSAAFNASTGKLIFNYSNLNDVFQVTSPTVANGIIYLGYFADLSNYSGGILALDAYSGKVIWDVRTYSFPFSSPAVDNGMIYFCNGNVIALDALTGKLVWHSSVESNNFSPVTVAGNYVFVGGIGGVLYCLNALVGTEIWNITTKIGPEVCPAVANGIVYAGEKALNISTGKTIWNNTLLKSSSPAIAGKVVYVSSYDNVFRGMEPYQYNVYGLDAFSGKIIWNYSLPIHYYAYFPDSPVVANGMLYVVPTAGQVYAFGKQQSSLPTEDGSQLANSIGSNFLLIGIIIIFIIAVVVLFLFFRRHRKNSK